MNILHIDEQRDWRGGEQQASYLIRGLAAEGYHNLAAGRPDGKFLNADHGDPSLVRVTAAFRGELDLLSARQLARAVREYDVDILHAHTSHAHTMACLASAFARKGTVVVSRRVDFAPRKHMFNRWKYALPDKIICVAAYIADILRAFGVENSRLAVVHSGIEPARFEVPPIGRAELGVPEGAPLIGNVAALVGHKDHTTLLAAMPLVLKHIPEAHLVIVGEGGLRPQLERQIAELALDDRVHLLGYRTDVPNILRALDLFVMSSKEEGFGGVCSEAMCCGVPVVATAAGGLPETVVHHKTGLLVPIRNPEALAAAIVRMFGEPELARALANTGERQARERFSAQRMVEGNLAVYEELLRTLP